MSSSARKKEKHRLKRKEKKHQLQRVQSRTALQRIAAEGGRLECWIMPKTWKDAGLATIRVLGRAPGGRAATVVFLVDFWAVGLKDVFGRGDVPELEFREGNLDPWIEESGAVKLDESIARRMIAGAVRFGRQNTFRMPPQWEKFAVIFGRNILNEIPTADVSDFGIDGGLRYVGTMEFLTTRLTIPPEQFLARPDVHYVMGEDPRLVHSLDQGTDEDAELDAETMENILKTTQSGAATIAEKVRGWIAAHDAEPIPMLDQAAKIMMYSLLPALGTLKDGKDPTDQELEDSRQLVKMMLATHDPQELEQISASVEKVREVVAQIEAERLDAERLQSDQPSGLADMAAPNATNAPE